MPYPPCPRRTLRRIADLGFLAAALLATECGPTGASPVPHQWIERWRADLAQAKTACEENHPDLFHSLDQATWNAEFDSLARRVPDLGHAAITVELARIIARLDDGHTRLTLPLGPGIEFTQGHSTTPDPEIPELRFHQFPIRFYLDDDGLHVERIAAQWKGILGAQVLRLGKHSAEDAMGLVEPTIRRDNEQQVLHHLTMHVVLAEILHARGVTSHLGRLPLTVRTREGQVRDVELTMVPHDTGVDWQDLRTSSAADPPLYRRHIDKNFWMTETTSPHTVYVQFNEVYDEEDETLLDFAGRLSRTLSSSDPQALIVDLRRNRGGDQGLARPLLYSILCSDLNRTGRLFVLAGRTTFSAAMLFALSLETHTRALFVGEPTGSRPNHYGDSRKTRLTHSGLTLRVSTRYWQNDPTDGRLAVHPHIPVTRTFEDEWADTDPVLDTVLGLVASSNDAPSPPPIALDDTNWAGTITIGLNTVPSRLSFTGGRVHLEVPDFEITLEAPPAHISGNRVLFETVWDGRELSFTGQTAGEWLIGDWSYRTRSYPFVWRRRGP